MRFTFIGVCHLFKMGLRAGFLARYGASRWCVDGGLSSQRGAPAIWAVFSDVSETYTGGR